MEKRDSVRTRKGFILTTVLFVSAIFTFHDACAQQFSAYGGLGVEYYKADGLSNYLNYAAPGSVVPGSFTSAIRFLMGGEVAVTKNWELGMEYEYLTKSITGSNAVGSQQVSLSYSLPSLTIRRLIPEDGYSIRLGGAFGYHFGGLSLSSPYSSQNQNFSAAGLGVDLDGSLDTKLGEKLYARVGVEARAEFAGDLKGADGGTLTYTDYNTGNQLPVNMHLFGVGVSFGLVYYF